jgi:hypothetical protein
MRGIRARLTTTLLALVALTASVLGVGSYLFVDLSLHNQVREDAADQARFDLSVLIPDRLPTNPTADDVVDSRLAETRSACAGSRRSSTWARTTSFVSNNAPLGGA